MTRVPFIVGRKTTLSLLEKEDVPQIQRWVNNSEVTRFLRVYLPMSRHTEEEWFEKISKATDQVVLGIENKEGNLIGTMGVHGIDYRNGTATTGALIGEPDYFGKGYGTDAKMYLLHWAFTELNLRKVCSQVLATNPRSKRYLEKTGYREVGVKKAHELFQGSFVDMYIMEIFKDEFLEKWNLFQKE